MFVSSQVKQKVSSEQEVLRRCFLFYFKTLVLLLEWESRTSYNISATSWFTNDSGLQVRQDVWSDGEFEVVSLTDHLLSKALIIVGLLTRWLTESHWLSRKKEKVTSYSGSCCESDAWCSSLPMSGLLLEQQDALAFWAQLRGSWTKRKKNWAIGRHGVQQTWKGWKMMYQIEKKRAIG